MDDSRPIPLAELQAIIRAGQLREWAFGEQNTYGAGDPYAGDFDRAADDFPLIIATGLARVYYDADGYFIGPVNPFLIESERFPSELGRPACTA